MSHTPETRRNWMSVLAKAPPARLAALAPDLPPHDLLRAPEIGAVMLEGRIGGTGGRFNLGEMTVTRCSVRLDCGTVGHSCVQGRDRDHARRAAVADALIQTEAAPRIDGEILSMLRSEAAAKKTRRAEKAAATRVEFFTMVRGEDK